MDSLSINQNDDFEAIKNNSTCKSDLAHCSTQTSTSLAKKDCLDCSGTVLFNIELETHLSVCRICLENGNDELIAPCRCNGTTKYVHERCWVQWFLKSQNQTCEICQGEVNIKNAGYKPLLKWKLPLNLKLKIVHLLIALYMTIMACFTSLVIWIGIGKCLSIVCIFVYAAFCVGAICLVYLCKHVFNSSNYIKSVLYVNSEWKVYGRKDKDVFSK